MYDACPEVTNSFDLTGLIVFINIFISVALISKDTEAELMWPFIKTASVAVFSEHFEITGKSNRTSVKTLYQSWDAIDETQLLCLPWLF